MLLLRAPTALIQNTPSVTQEMKSKKKFCFDLKVKLFLQPELSTIQTDMISGWGERIKPDVSFG